MAVDRQVKKQLSSRLILRQVPPGKCDGDPQLHPAPKHSERNIGLPPFCVNWPCIRTFFYLTQQGFDAIAVLNKNALVIHMDYLNIGSSVNLARPVTRGNRRAT